MSAKAKVRLRPELIADPAEAHAANLQAHHKEEEREDPQVKSLCNHCKHAFRYATKGEEWDDEPHLRIFCAGPWFKDAERVYGVTECNGYVNGEFGAVGIQKALPSQEEEESEKTEEKDEGEADKAEPKEGKGEEKAEDKGEPKEQEGTQGSEEKAFIKKSDDGDEEAEEEESEASPQGTPGQQA